MFNNDIIFPKDIQYLEDGYYLCTGQMRDKYVVSEGAVAKLTQHDFDKLIRTIHSAIYTKKTKHIEFKNMHDDLPLPLYISPNGKIECFGCSCVVYVPRNCLKWDCAILRGYDNDSYILEPCDKKGRIVERERSDINPYTNNCNIVYNVIAENSGISTSEIIDVLGWPPNSVTSRLSELMAGGRITSVGKVLNPKSGRKVHKWMTMEEVEGNCYVL